MYCPNCGNQFSEGQKYCRTCGTNLAIIAKAVTLSEAIGRSDRGTWPKIKTTLENLGIDVNEISQEVEQMTRDIDRGLHPTRSRRRHRKPSEDHLLHGEDSPTRRHRRRAPEQERENHIVKGFINLFTGVGMAIFLYYIAGFVILRIPPNTAARIPFELEPVIRNIWLIGLIPMLAGLGQVIGGFLTQSSRDKTAPALPVPPVAIEPLQPSQPTSVTEHTTELLESSEASIPARTTARQQE